MPILKEFKEFATKGNVIDLAVGVIIGGAFGKIVDSVVNDLIMPVAGIFFKADFSNLYIRLSSKITKGLPLADARKMGPVFAWGNFITVVLNFLILAFIIFMLIKMINSLKRKQDAAAIAAAPPPEPSNTDKLLTEIRDLLKQQQ